MKYLYYIFEKLINLISIFSMLVMVFLVFTNVILRYFFDSGISWSEELSRLAFIWLVFLGIVIAQRENGHLKMELLLNYLPNKIKKIVDFIAILISVVILFSIVIGGVKLSILTYSQGLPATGISYSTIYGAGTVCILFVLLKLIASFFSK